MRRIISLFAVAALLGAMMALMAVPAFATIHQLSEAQCAASPESAANTTLQDPPGISPDRLDSVGNDFSDDIARENAPLTAQPTAKPLNAIRAQDGMEVSTAEQNAFKDEVCPAVSP
jgi:hypothetical protein